MKFYLKKLPTGRVYISQIAPLDSEEVLQEIDAEKWIKAREEVLSMAFEQREGHGFFAV